MNCLAGPGFRAVLVAGALAAAALFHAATAAVVTRGPYLQQGTPENIIVRWRTSNATGGLVRYGTNVSNLNFTATDGLTTNRHTVAISGLNPDTKYFYELGTESEWFPGDTNQFFV